MFRVGLREAGGALCDAGLAPRACSCLLTLRAASSVASGHHWSHFVDLRMLKVPLP